MKIKKSSTCKDLTLHSSFESCPIFSTQASSLPISFSSTCKSNTIYYPKNNLKALETAKNLEFLLTTPKLLSCPFIRLEYSDTAISNKTRHLLAELSPKLFEEYGIKNNQRAYIINLQNFYIHTVTLCKRKDVPDGCIFISNKLKNLLDGTQSIAIMLPECTFMNKCNIQGVDKIRDDIVSVSKDDYILLKEQNVSSFELRHLKTGACVTIPFSKIEKSSGTPQGRIKLSYYYRETLNINTSKLLIEAKQNNHKYLKILNKISRIDPESFAEERFIHELPKDYHELQLFPIYKKFKSSKSAKQRICDTLVGRSSLNLLAVRPYSVDDARDIIRLSNDSMQLLGIEDGDRVVLSYGDKNYSAMALQIDSFELVDDTNILTGIENLDIIVGVPAPIRSYLGIDDIETGITVRRDTEFLLKKNFNIQLMPLAALILTVFQLDALSYPIQILICILLSPFIMYATLSQERNKVKRKNPQQK